MYLICINVSCVEMWIKPISLRVLIGSDNVLGGITHNP